jgi:hypothetical protein
MRTPISAFQLKAESPLATEPKRPKLWLTPATLGLEVEFPACGSIMFS